MAEVRTTFTSDDKEVQKSLAAMQKEMGKLIEQNRQLKEAGKGASDGLTGGMDRAIDQIKSMAAGYLSVQAALQLVGRELDAVQQRQEKARQQQVSSAASEDVFLSNAGVKTPEDVKQLRQQVAQIARESKTDAGQVYRVASQGVSATTSRESMLETVRLAMRSYSVESEQIAMAGALGDTANLTGTADPSVNAGFIQQALQNSRLSTIGGIGKYVIGGASQIKAQGGTASDAVGLMNTLTKILVDTEGGQSRTMGVSLADRLAEALPKDNLYEYDEKGRKKLKSKGTGLDSTAARLAYLEQNQTEREKFFATAALPQGGAMVKAMLTPGTVQNQVLKQNVGLPELTNEQLTAITEQHLGAKGSSPLQKSAELDRALQSSARRQAEKDFSSGTAASLKSGMQSLRSASGASWLEQFVRGSEDTFVGMVHGAPGLRERALQDIQSGINEREALPDVFKQRGESVSEVVAELKALKDVLQNIDTNTGKKLNIDGNNE